MNLHEIVSSAISAINPFQQITIIRKGGYTVDDYGVATASTIDTITVMADVQPVSSEDIKFITNYNQSTIYKAFWVSEQTSGLNRPLGKGGDIIEWAGNKYYIVTMPEDWYKTCGWSHFIGALQLGDTNANT